MTVYLLKITFATKENSRKENRGKINAYYYFSQSQLDLCTFQSSEPTNVFYAQARLCGIFTTCLLYCPGNCSASLWWSQNQQACIQTTNVSLWVCQFLITIVTNWLLHPLCPLLYSVSLHSSASSSLIMLVSFRIFWDQSHLMACLFLASHYLLTQTLYRIPQLQVP